jgi:hypothetical protein
MPSVILRRGLLSVFISAKASRVALQFDLNWFWYGRKNRLQVEGGQMMG